MFKSLAALAILGAVSAPVTAQAAQPAPAAQVQPAKPQMVKKRVCEDNDNPATTIHRVCKTVMVPVQPDHAATNNQQNASANTPNTSAY